MPYRRLEDHIRELCAKAIASDDTALPTVMVELRSALQEQVDKIRTLAVRQLAGEGPRGDDTRE